MFYKKAQAAMEFLMTYGWAILVVLVAIGALAYFGVLNPGKFLPSSCTLVPGLSCDNFKVKSDSSGEIVFTNGLGADLNAVSMKIGTVASSNCAGTITIPDGNTTKCSFASLQGVGSAGSKFKADLTVTYTTGSSPTNVTHSKVGTLITNVES